MASPRRDLIVYATIVTLTACATQRAPQLVATRQVVDVRATNADGGIVAEDGGDEEPRGGGVITLADMACGPDAVSFAHNEVAIDAEGAKTVAKEADAWRDAMAHTVVEVAAFSAPNEKDAVALSQRRAEAIVEALVIAGVDRRILRPVGYGAYCAMAPDVSMKDPHQRNRFAYLLQTASASGPTDVHAGCEAARKAGIGVKP